MTITINANADRYHPVDDDWGVPLQIALDYYINHRLAPTEGEEPETIELVFCPGEYNFKTGLRIWGSYINIIGSGDGDGPEATIIVHDPTEWGRNFIPFLFQHDEDHVSDLDGIGELNEIHISRLRIEFLQDGGQARPGVDFVHCRNFSCRHVTVLARNPAWMAGSHTNGISVTGYSSFGEVSDCTVDGMSAPGIYISISFDVDVIDCNVLNASRPEDHNGYPNHSDEGPDYSGPATGFRVSSSRTIRFRGCNAIDNAGSGIQISHNYARLLGSTNTPGSIVEVTGNSIEFYVDLPPDGVGLPSKLDAAHLGVENLDTHRIEEIWVDEVQAYPMGEGRQFVVHFLGSIPSGTVSLDHTKLYINFIPNYDIRLEDCVSRGNHRHGIEIGSELHGAVGSSISFYRVTCERNLLNGIVITCAEDVTIRRCVCSQNIVNGVHVTDTAMEERFEPRPPLEPEEEPPVTDPIFWNLTRNVRIPYGCEIRNNHNGGIAIIGANDVWINGVDITTDIPSLDDDLPAGVDPPEYYHRRGCIYVQPFEFLTGPLEDRTPHTERIEDIRIERVSFIGEAVDDDEFTVDSSSFINRLITRGFHTDDDYDYERHDTEGVRLPDDNRNAVVSGRYHLSFPGDPNGHVHAPYGSTFSSWIKRTEEHSNVGWIREQDSRTSDFGNRWRLEYERPLESKPLYIDDLRPEPDRGRASIPILQRIVSRISQEVPVVDRRITAGDTRNINDSGSFVRTIYKIADIEKTEIVKLEELKATQPQRPEGQGRVLVEQLVSRNGVNQRPSSGVITLREQKMPVLQQLDSKDRIKI